MHLVFLVEEPSAKEVMNNLLPKIMGEEHTFEIIRHQGKGDLLKKLPQKLQAYKRWIPNHYRIVVLIDQDNDDCKELKSKLNEIAEEHSFVTKTRANLENRPNFQILNRIVISELEAWYFGDVQAIQAAFPRLKFRFDQKANYRIPDQITKPSKALERILQRYQYYKSGLQKLDCARRISVNMNPLLNTSKSFQMFLQGLQELLQKE